MRGSASACMWICRHGKTKLSSSALCAAIFMRQCLFLLLQEGWEILPNEADGRPYYVNEATGASQWEQPSAS